MENQDILQENQDKSNELARILIYGDIHLSSKNYGAHRDYPKESLDIFRKITDEAIKNQVTHIIGLGDFTYGRFHSLEYRLEVEKMLEEQYKLTSGNRYELKGNHDVAGYGMTEYQYYINKGYLKPSTNLTIGNVNISMLDYGKLNDVEILDTSNEDQLNVLLAHDYFKFNDTQLPNFGDAYILDNLEKLYGIDYLICGHVHARIIFDGLVVKGTQGHKMMAHYVGAMTRPSYREGMVDEIGNVVLLTIYNDGQMKYETIDIELWPIEKSFNLEQKAAEKQKKEEKESRVDIGDIVAELASHERNVGNPEDIIAAISGVDDKYKNKAIELLKEGMA